jgi:hypothetical protein
VSCGLRQADDAEFRGAVDAAVWKASEASHTRYVYYAAAFLNSAQLRSQAVEHAFEIDPDDLVPVVVRLLRKRFPVTSDPFSPSASP